MEGEGELLDLSHLSEAEQSSILEVLLRDSELRSRDEGRLRALQQKEADPVRLRSLSGAWFNEERSKRHRDTKDGVDIVQASIRRRKPRTGQTTHTHTAIITKKQDIWYRLINLLVDRFASEWGV
uniref:RabBD domain-containing protein n=1 Tax=Hucho hucho TaxID=62062 RepID=A0A4W5NCR8_9TELE